MTTPEILTQVQGYSTLLQVPEITSAQLTHKGKRFDLQVNYSQRDLSTETLKKYSRFYTSAEDDFQSGDSPFYSVGVPVAATETMSSLSPSGRFRVVFMVKNKGSSPGDADEYSIELWSGTHLLSTTTSKGVHGNLNTDDNFGGIHWNKDETAVVYAAEKERPKRKTFFEAQDGKKDAQSDSGNPVGEKFEYVSDWGETLTNCCSPGVFVFTWVKGALGAAIRPRVFAVNVLDGHSCGDPLFTADGRVVYAGEDKKERLYVAETDGHKAWNEEPRLGVRMCFMRPSGIYITDKPVALVEGEVTSEKSLRISKEFSARSPRMNDEGTGFVYLAVDQKIPHNNCNKIIHVQLGNMINARTVLDVIKTPVSANESEYLPETFAGAYLGTLPRRCWMGSEHIVFDTAWQSNHVIVRLHLGTGSIARISPFDSSHRVLDVLSNAIVAACSAPNSPATLKVLHTGETGSNFVWRKGTEDEEDEIQASTREELSRIKWDVLSVNATSHRQMAAHPCMNTFETIVLLPPSASVKPEGKVPLLLVPHGGPHSVFGKVYTAGPAFMCLQGYAVALVNYRGSTGFGQDPIEYLLDKAGDMDVRDCVDAGTAVCQAYPNVVDPLKWGVWGGSHGGFLATHLVGQFPEKFQAAVVRNPVCNIAGMVFGTDIPDWCFAESGLKPSALASASDVQAMYKASPIQHVEKVKAPVLFQIGLLDGRVPPYQAHYYANVLQARNVPVKVYTYPKDMHGLTGVECDADCMLHIAQWFNKYM